MEKNTFDSVIKSKDFSSQKLLYQVRTNQADIIMFFTEINKSFPSNRYFSSIKLLNPIDEFKKRYKIPEENIITSEWHEKKDGENIIHLNSFNFIIEKDLIVSSYSDGNPDMYNFRVFFSSKTTNKKKLENICTYLMEHYEESKNSEIGIIGNGANGLFVRFFKVNVPDINVDFYYNDDFSEVHNRVLNRLKSTTFKKGVILFHGKPGTGKCVDGGTIVTLRNKKTGKIENISIDDFEKLLWCTNRFRIEYWLRKGYTEDDAKKEISKIQRKNASKVNQKTKPHTTRIEYWLNKGYNEEEAKQKLKERQSTFSLKKCIEKYGDIDGLKIYNERQIKWQKTLNENNNKSELDKKKYGKGI